MECPCYRCYCCDEKLTKARWGGNVLFYLHLYIIVLYWKTLGQKLKHGRILEPGDLTEAVEVCCVLDCDSWFIFILFSYRIQDQHPRMAPPTMEWKFLINHKIRKCSIVRSYESIFSVEVPEDSRLYQADLKLASKRILILCNRRNEEPISSFYIWVCCLPNIICWIACPVFLSVGDFFFDSLSKSYYCGYMCLNLSLSMYIFICKNYAMLPTSEI